MVAAMMFQRRQKKFNGTEKLDTIDVDSVQLKQSKQEKFWIKELNLLEQDREILLNPAGELTDEVRVYCTCRMPELPDTKWIECSRCKNWFHLDTCVSPSSAALTTSLQWYCRACAYITP